MHVRHDKCLSHNADRGFRPFRISPVHVQTFTFFFEAHVFGARVGRGGANSGGQFCQQCILHARSKTRNVLVREQSLCWIE